MPVYITDIALGCGMLTYITEEHIYALISVRSYLIRTLAWLMRYTLPISVRI